MEASTTTAERTGSGPLRVVRAKSTVAILTHEVFRARAIQGLTRPDLGRTPQEFLATEPGLLTGDESRYFLALAGDGDFRALRHLVQDGAEVVLHFGVAECSHDLFHGE